MRREPPSLCRGSPFRPCAPIVFAVALAGTFLAPVLLQGQEPERRVADDTVAAFSGKIVSGTSGDALEDAQVVLQMAELQTLTDSLGRFAFPRVRPGLEVASVRLIGFAEVSVPVQLRPGHNTSVTLRLSPQAIRMEDITVTVRQGWRLTQAGFYHRRNVGTGTYIGPKQIEKRDPQHTTDLLRSVPGIRVSSPRFGHAQIQMRRAAWNRYCPPLLWVDGTFSRAMTVDDIDAEDLLAMEIYKGASQTPAQFRRSVGGADCGAIVLWTRLGG